MSTELRILLLEKGWLNEKKSAPKGPLSKLNIISFFSLGNITWDVFRNTSVVSHCYDRRFGPQLSENILSNLSYLPNGYNIPFKEVSNEEGLACHWAFFERPSNFLFYLMGSLYAVIAFFGLIGNGLVILIFCR